MGAPSSAVRGRGRDLILAAAREVFAARGYARATVAEICSAAGVTEPTLYWHFCSKRGLFEATVSDPVTDFMHTYLDGWRTRTPGEREALAEAVEYLSGLYDVLQAQRPLLLAAIADASFGDAQPSAAVTLEQHFGDVLRRHQDVLRIEFERRGYRSLDLPVISRLFFSGVFMLAVHGELIGVSAAAARTTYIPQMAELALLGVHPPRKE